MFSSWNWHRIGTFVGGAACIAAGVLFPPLGAVLIPIGSGAVGLTLSYPGTVSVPKDPAPPPPAK